MKLAVNKKQFLGSWSLAERSTSAGGTVSILSSILVKASAESVILQATDIKTSVICRAAGVSVLEPGEAVFPIKMVSDLFKKAPGEEFTLDVDGGKVVLKAGRSKYNFSTYPVSEFPALPSSDEADLSVRYLRANSQRFLTKALWLRRPARNSRSISRRLTFR